MHRRIGLVFALFVAWAAPAMGQDQPDRPDQMRRFGHQDLTLLQRMAHQPEIVSLQITQASMDQLGGARGCTLGKIPLFGQCDREAAPRRIAGDGSAIDAATDDEEIVERLG